VAGAAESRPASLDELHAHERGFEIVGGELLPKAGPTGEHGAAQAAVTAAVFPSRGGAAKPFGWWFGVEVEIELAAGEVYLPDVAGWRRARHPERPVGQPVRAVPDWVCEVLSDSTARRDLGRKRGVYHACRVGHYWIVDPRACVLTVFRWSETGYVLVASHGPDERARCEPFEDIEFWVGDLFGVDEPTG
jgi:Uma2 family endonuclease